MNSSERDPELILPPARQSGEQDRPAPESPAKEVRVSTPPRKWGEIVQDRDVPLDESLRRRAARPFGADRLYGAGAIAHGSSSRHGGPAAKLIGGGPGTLAAVTCRYDGANRRLHDFQLPDAQGKPVSLKDFDSDLILLDFWGTWCVPCRTSIPQLVEFQKRFGQDRLQVIGIACERAAADKRPELVSKARKDLAINYPTLITGKDGPCALQEALQVQFYPTMILMDRHGQILWREPGATATTLARLERAIHTALKPRESARASSSQARLLR